MTAEERDQGCYASPPCFMHELGAAFGIDGPVDQQQLTDVMRWRRAERHRLIAERQRMSLEARREADARIAAHLKAALGDVRGLGIGLYWPVQGEPDLRGLMAQLVAAGAQCALPASPSCRGPVVFRQWSPGEPLQADGCGIPSPLGGGEVTPDVLVMPALGFDRTGHRLGYGGGGLDRALAALSRRPRLIGVAYAQAAIPTIFPQAHDVPMDAIVTEAGIVTAEASGSAGGDEDR